MLAGYTVRAHIFLRFKRPAKASLNIIFHVYLIFFLAYHLKRQKDNKQVILLHYFSSLTSLAKCFIPSVLPVTVLWDQKKKKKVYGHFPKYQRMG